MRIQCLTTVVLALATNACGLTGPSCLARQERGTATTLDGEVGAGGIVSHLVAYDSRGSQNDVRIVSPDLRSLGAPRIELYVTKSACSSFQLPAASNVAECVPLGQAGVIGDAIVTQSVITHGRGNPEMLGSPPEYKVWLVGDPNRSVRYTISTTWFFGPDC